MNRIQILSSKFLAPLFVACMLIFSACSNPSSKAQKIVEEKIRTKSLGNFKLTNFQKVDAVASEKDGVQIYTVNYTGTIETMRDDGNFEILYNGMINLAVDPTPYTRKTKKGEKFQVKGFIKLAKHEEGWVQVLNNGGDGYLYVAN